MAKRLIGTGTTGTDGSCSIPYTGTGAGLVQMDVETEIDGSIVSETYSVWDYLFYDDGITTPKTANWNNYSDRLTVTVDETGTTLFRDASSGTGYYFTPSAYSTPFAIEFEMVDTGTRTSNGLDFANGSSDNNKNFNQLYIQNGTVVKITYDGETIKVYRNGSTTPATTLNLTISNDVTIGFFITPNESIKFKNFRMYKI